MRGKRAKNLRRKAAVVCRAEGTKLGEGYNVYNQAMNRYTMLTAESVGGEYTHTPEAQPGTITTAWRLRAIYKILKTAWKRGGSNVSYR